MASLQSPLALRGNLLRVSCPASTATRSRVCPSTAGSQQIRRATFIHRPRRPYTFTQLIQLSDGSVYTQRTTSPQPLYRATKDTRNTLLWQPSERSLRNREEDEAGKLAAFRQRFGRAYDQHVDEGAEGGDAAAASDQDQGGLDDFSSLISSYALEDTGSMKDAGGSGPTKGGKKK